MEPSLSGSQFPCLQARWCWYYESVLLSVVELADERAENLTAVMKVFHLFKSIFWICFADEKRSSVDNVIEVHPGFPCEDAKLEYAKLLLNSSKCHYILVSHVITQTAFPGDWKCCFIYQERDPILLFCIGPQKTSSIYSVHSRIPWFFFTRLSHPTEMDIPIQNLSPKHLAFHILTRL